MAERKDVEDRICERCGKSFNRPRFPSGGRQSVATFLRRRFCSVACRGGAPAHNHIDLTGKRFGHLVVLSRVPQKRTGRGSVAYWECRCDCGEVCVKRYKHLAYGTSTSCGCQAKCPPSELVGFRFGRLVVLERAENTRQKTRRWRCQCDCGSICIARTANLRNGHTRSCGCWQREVVADQHRTHGLSHLPEYKTWANMLARCERPQHVSFPIYGERGIRVCERWQTFENFLADMGSKPTPRHSLDRLDPNGNYEPGNCQWATHRDQLRNRRCSRLFTYAGRTMLLSEWAAEAGWFEGQRSVYIRAIKRLDDLGWSFEDALFTPPRDGFHSPQV